MSTAPWRTGLTRWSDPVYWAALLLLPEPAAADIAFTKACCKVFSSPLPDDTEVALLHALISQPRHRRLFARTSMLQGPLRRIAPLDRVLLSLWLLREMDAQRIAAAIGQPPEMVVTRLSQCIARVAGLGSREAACQTSLPNWIRTHVGLDALTTEHLRACETCRTASVAWQYAVDQLRATLRTWSAEQRPPSRCLTEIEKCLQERQSPSALRGWQTHQTRYLALGIGIALFVGWMVWPQSRQVEQAGAPTAHALVQATLEAWTSSPSSSTLHRRVRALDGHMTGGKPVVTDIWLAGSENGRHRIEVRRGETLTEWQIGDGERRFNYGATWGAGSCPWDSTTLSPSTPASLSFRLSPEQQRAARDARLQQGAYGRGYAALRQAITAPDLRSFGRRSAEQRSLVVLSYTDVRATEPEQILLAIDPAAKQLHSVQVLAADTPQSPAHDLWRLEKVDQSVEPLSTRLPPWSRAVARSDLPDPGCPALRSNQVLSLRAIVGAPWQQWYVPNVMPTTLTRGAMLSLDVPVGSATTWGAPPGSSMRFVGPDRWVTLTAGTWMPNAGSSEDFKQGMWRVALRSTSDAGAWRATLRLTRDRYAPAFVPTVELAAHGWTRGEVLAFIDALTPITAGSWLELHPYFVEPRPLSPDVHLIVTRALQALQPSADQTNYTATEITIRPSPPSPALVDPYAPSATVRNPTTLHRYQWLVQRGSRTTNFYDIYKSSEGAVYQALIHDGVRSVFDNRAAGWVGVDSSQELSAVPEPPGVEMLTSLLRSTDALSVTEQPGAWVLERSDDFTQEQLLYEFRSQELPIPWTEELQAGTLTRRLTLDQQTALPGKFQLVHRDQQGHETLLYQVMLTEQHRLDRPPGPELTVLPELPDDVLRFSSTAARWRRARIALPRLSSHWLTANLDAPQAPMLVDTRLDQQHISRVLAWPASDTIGEEWTLLPVTPLRQLNLGTLQATSWHDLSELSALHRAQYRIADVRLTVTQGPTRLLRNLLRYSASPRSRAGLPWTTSRELRVTIRGTLRDAWLLQDEQFASLVVEVDELILHIVGPADYLSDPLRQHLPSLVWSTPGI